MPKASNSMTSRYASTWNLVKNEKGEIGRAIVLLWALRGVMHFEALDVETFPGTARRSSQRLLASAAACKKQWIIASLDISVAFLIGFTFQGLAEATGDKERVACFALPPGPASALGSLSGLDGSSGRPREFGLKPTSCDEEFETSSDLRTAKHVDDINMAGTKDTFDKCAKCVEDMIGK
eukprot:3049884-Pyramimonas_sp.AAC.1